MIGSGIRVLHVDDEPEQCVFVKLFIKEFDPSLEVESAPSPIDALRLLEERSFDCVVSDYQMPGMDGVELARRIRETSGIPFILYTGRGSEEVAERAFGVGVDDYIRKEIHPTHYQVLARRIRSAVEERKALEELIRSEERYRTLLEQLPDPVTVRIGDKRVYVTERAAEFLGYDSVSDLLIEEDSYIVASNDRPFVKDRRERREKGEELPSMYEIKMRKVDGSTVDVEVHTAPIDYQGTPALMNIMRDITERKKREEEVIYLNRLLRAIRNVNQLIVHEGDRDKLRDGITRLLVESGGYFNAWIVLFDGEGRFVSASQSGLGDGFQPLLEMIEGGEPPECGRKALEQPGVHVIGDPVSECADCPLSGGYHGRSGLSVRLEHSGTVYGLLAASVPRHMITEEERMLFGEIAEDIGYALHSMEVEDERKRGEWTLGERVKELNCFYGISNLVESGLDIEGILGGVVALIPPAMQHPVEACARITLDGRRYETDNFRETSQALSADIKIQGENVGSLMVCYLEEVPEGEGEMFLPEEGELVNALAERLGRITERKRREEELRRSEGQFRLILESGMDGVSIVADDKLVYMNDRFCKMLGYDDPSELLGLESMEIVHPSSRDLLREKKRKREQGDTEPALYELEMLKKDGSTFTSEALTSVIEYEGKPARLGFNRDITERKRYEERLKTLHRHVAELNKVSTMEEVYAFTLDAMERGLGFSRGAFLVVEGENLMDVMLRGLNEDRPYTLPLDGKGLTVKAMRTGESVLVPDVSLDPDYIDVGVGIKSELVVPVKIYGVAAAVLNTESTELDGYTEYDQVILEILAEHVAFAMKRISDETVRERYLDGLEALHRYAPELAQAETLAEIGEKTFDAIESVLGFEFGSLSVVEGDLLRHVYIRGFEGREPLEMPLDGPGVTVRAVRTGETQLVPDTRKDEDFVPGYAEGAYEVISELAVPVKIDDEVMAVLNAGSDRVNAYDADDRRLLEILTHHVSSALDRLKRVDSLERLVKERTEELLDVEWMMAAGRVAATMAHDLRSPLQTIKNTLFLLKKSPQNASSLLERLDRAVDRTNGLLEEFRSKTRQEPLRVKETDLAALIRTTTGEAAIPEHVEVRLQLGAGLEAVTMDPSRVRRMLDNLVMNAVEALPKGGNLTVTAEKEDNRIVINVSDTGVGIPDEAMANLFKPFQTTKKGGLGLGLAYCKRAVEDHGGTITVESKVGEGTTFTISLPLREE
ncbi:MAG: GAF domain-containing protein [Candidatus Bathyarchaeota archaeon]|nr:GAF domain-containing protein [Candidatus Bathyarchaeota archaeon]